MRSHILLLLYWIKVLAGISTASKIILHKTNGGGESYMVTGDQCESGVIFDSAQEFSCVCTTGLWALFRRNCEQVFMLVGGIKEQCIHIDFQISKAVLLSPELPLLSSATVFDSSVASMGGKFVSSSVIPNKAHFAPTGFPIVITTGNQTWRLPFQKLCLKPNSMKDRTYHNQFCIFNIGTDDEYRMDESVCASDDNIIAPLQCTSFMDDKDLESRSCSRRVRRKVNKKKKPQTKNMQGRAFVDTIQGFQESTTENEVNLTSADENSGLTGAADMPVMNSELWNYMTLRAQEMLGLRERRKKEKNEGAYQPAFTFLELSKDIQQKACPDHYVPDDHYDVAVGAFLSILQNHYKFTDPFLDVATSERIEDTLRACLANITEYPFLERTAKPSPLVESQCNDSKPIEHGAYFMFDQMLDMTLPHDLASRSNEPIVETVWKIFIHAHSACYQFFENNLNDHHRFATVMLQLFTSGINDLWFNMTELKPDVYTGFLGDAVDLMDSVAYCSQFSRLESKYPWDLPRPKKNNAGEGGDGAGAGAGAPPPPPARRRRAAFEENEITSEDFKCLHEHDARNFCSSFEFNPDSEDYDAVRVSL